MHADTLIQLAMQQLERKSIRALAERMDIAHTKVAAWKKGEAPMPEERIRQIARIANQDPGPWLLLIKSEQEEGELGREWAKLAKRLAASAAAVIVLVGTALPGPASAENKAFSHDTGRTNLDIMRNYR